MAPQKKKKPAPKKAKSKKKPLKKRSPARPKVKKKPRARPQGVVKDNPEAKALADVIAQAIVDAKGTDVLILDVRGKASYADYIVVASGDTERMVSALGEAVEEKLKPQGKKPLGREGEQTGNWVLLDYGEVIAHLFLADARGFYDLEGLWADAPRQRVT